MTIAIGSDHAGFRYKELLKSELSRRGHPVTDFGTDSEAPVDYPLYIRPVAEAVARGQCERGIVLGGSGNGEAIVANRVPGIRAVVAWHTESARAGRAHNDCNVLSLGQRFIAEARPHPHPGRLAADPLRGRPPPAPDLSHRPSGTNRKTGTLSPCRADGPMTRPRA